MDFEGGIELLGLAINVAAVVVIFVSAIAAGVVFARGLLDRSVPVEEGYRQLRRGIGRGVLLGLELLVAGDIIRTVAIEPTCENVGVLAAIVAVRTFLSFALEVELTGRWPWDRAASTS